MPSDDHPELIKGIKAAATYLGLPVRQVREYERHKIPHLRFGSRLYFNPRALDGWLESHTLRYDERAR